MDQQGFEPPPAVCQRWQDQRHTNLAIGSPATKLLEKARQKLQEGIQNIPSQRVNDLEAAIRQLRQIGCILDSCTISASYEVTQAQKAILQLDHTARGASTSSEELNAQISPRTDDEHNLPYHEGNLQEHKPSSAHRNHSFDADAGKKTTEH